MTIDNAENILRALPDVTEKDHWGGDAFVANKRIFATAWHEENKVNVRLTPELQRQFIQRDKAAFSTWDNAWGRQGWTSIALDKVKSRDFRTAIHAAFEHSATAAPLGFSKKSKVRRK